MYTNFRILIRFSGLFIILSTFPIKAQLLNDSAAVNLVKKDIDFIYNLEFTNARMFYARIISAYPEHPVVYLLRGMITYWENYPLLDASPAKDSFKSDLRTCIKIAERKGDPEHEAESLLANLVARGFLLMFYADNNLTMEVIPLTTGTYKYLMRSFDFTFKCADLYYFTGMYNYYRDAYPKVYPVYKPVALLFPAGDMKRGLYQLDHAAKNSVVLRAESNYLLTYIFENFENDYSRAYEYSSLLHELYPQNVQFLAVYLKNLLLLKRYNETEKILESLQEGSSNKYFQGQVYIFRGILQEKKYSDNKAAKQFYEKGIREISVFGDYGREYTSYAYFGLSRISKAKGEIHQSQMYRKEALKLAAFKNIEFDD